MMKRWIILLCLALAFLSLTGNARAYTAELSYFFDGLNIETGDIYTDPAVFVILPEDPIVEILQPEPGFTPNFDSSVDLFLSYQPDVGAMLNFLPKAFDDPARIVAMLINDATIPVDFSDELVMLNIPLGEPITFITLGDQSYEVTIHTDFGVPVPEPGMFVLLGLGLVGIVGLRRRKIRKVVRIGKMFGRKALAAVTVFGLMVIWGGTVSADWQPRNTGLTSIYVEALAIDPTVPTTLYAGTYGNVFKSTNAGTTWTKKNSGLDVGDFFSEMLAIDPITPTTLYASAFKSIDGGESWSLQNVGLPPYVPVFALAIDPITPTTLYAGLLNYGGDVSGVFKSTNAGASWTAMNTGLLDKNIRSLAIDPITPTTLYAGTDSCVFKSLDAGRTWTIQNTGFIYPEYMYIYTLAIDPNTPTTIYAGTHYGVFKSMDAGATWTWQNVGLTAPGWSSLNVLDIEIDPMIPTTLYASTYGGGVFKSTNAGANWIAMNTGLTNLNVNSLAIDPTMPTTLYAGTDGGGVFVYTPSTVTISGIVKTTDGVPVAEVIMQGFPDNPMTDVTGAYQATVSYGWSGTVTPQKDGYTFTPADRTYTNVTANQIEQDYTGTRTQAAIIYVNVNAPSPGDGQSWATAYTDLQAALAAADVNGDEIWVACGVYKPGLTVDSTFQLKDGVALYGGFAGTETQRNQRNWTANITVLSGDIDGNDNIDANGVVADRTGLVGTNAYHVVTGSGTSGTAVLDGFTVTAGQATGGNCPQACGGGMYNSHGSPTLTNITFSGNAVSQCGGGMMNEWNSNPMLTNVIFSGNWATVGGGGMYNNWESNSILTNIIFSGNSAPYGNGGGMYNDRSSPTLTNVIFRSNSSGTSWAGGGGMFNYFYSSPTLNNVTFMGNSAIKGGGLHNRDYSSPKLINVTFNGNQASNAGGGIYNDNNSNPTMVNAILWGNSPSEIVNSSSTITITYSNVQGGWSGQGNINTDPIFVNSEFDDLRLQATSPAIDAGNDAAVTVSTDLDGNPRISGAHVDMGAYEVQMPTMFTITGIIKLADGTGIPEVLLQDLPGNPMTDANGAYQANVPSGWSGTVTPQKDGYMFTPDSRTYTNLTADQIAQDYTGTSIACIGADYVWDANTVLLDNFNHATTAAYVNGTPQYNQGMAVFEADDWARYDFTGWYQWPWEYDPQGKAGTVEIWVNPQQYPVKILPLQWYVMSSPNETGGYGYIFHLQINNSDKAGVGYWTAVSGGPAEAYTFESSTTIPLNQWTHLAYTWGADGSRLYVNGQVESYTPVVFYPGMNATTTYAYLNYWGGSAFMAKGFRISNIARTEFNTACVQTISGKVATADGTGIADVTFAGLPGIKTDAGGMYRATVARGWSGTVTPQKDGYIFRSASRTYTNVAVNQTDHDYTGIQIFDYHSYDDHPGTAHDAEKTGANDSNKCHAAASSNILAWSGFNQPPAYDTEQQIFSYFQTDWENKGSLVKYATRCWIDGTLPPFFGEDWATASSCPGYFPAESGLSSFAGTYESHWTQATLMDAVTEYLHNGYGTTIALYDHAESAALGHVLSVWGYRYDAKGNVLGLWITDSDDLSADVSAEPPQEWLLPVEYTTVDGTEAKWRVTVASQSYAGWLIEGAEALKPQTATTPAAELPRLAIVRKKCVDNDTGAEIACPADDNVTVYIGDQVCDEECKRLTFSFDDNDALVLRVMIDFDPNDPVTFKGWEVNGEMWTGGAYTLAGDVYLRPVIGCKHD